MAYDLGRIVVHAMMMAMPCYGLAPTCGADRVPAPTVFGLLLAFNGRAAGGQG